MLAIEREYVKADTASQSNQFFFSVFIMVCKKSNLGWDGGQYIENNCVFGTQFQVLLNVLESLLVYNDFSELYYKETAIVYQ